MFNCSYEYVLKVYTLNFICVKSNSSVFMYQPLVWKPHDLFIQTMEDTMQATRDDISVH